MELQQACRGFLRQASLVLDQTNRADEASLVLSLLLDVLEGFCTQQEPDNQTSPHTPRVNLAEVDGAQLRSKPHLRPLAACLDALQAAQRGASNVWATVCWHCMDSLVEILLQAAEASWWEGLANKLQERVQGMLEKAPAPTLLYSLSGYLGMLARAPPSSSNVSQDQSAVAMLGSHTAASLLQRLFTDDNSHGIAELVLYSAAMTRIPQDQNVTATLDSTQQTSGPQTSHQPQGAHMQAGQPAGAEPQQQPILLLPPGWQEQHHQQHSLGVPAAYKPVVGVTGLAGLLAALPDRLAPYMPRHGAMRHEGMYTRMMAQLLQFAAQPCYLVNQQQQQQPPQPQQQQQPQQEQQQQWEQPEHRQQGQQQQGVQQHLHGMSTAAAADVPPGAIAACAAALCTQLMARLCTRGYTQLVAQALLSAPHTCPPVPCARTDWPAAPTQLLQQAILPAIIANLLHQPPITSRLLQALLVASAHASTAYQTSSAYPGASVGRTSACTPSAEAYSLLHLLGGHHALASHPEMQYVLSEQLLAHHTLPTPAIHLLLDVLEAASHGWQTSTAAEALKKSAVEGAPTPAQAAWWTAALMQQGLDGGGLSDLDSTIQLPGAEDAAHEDAEEGVDLGQVAAGLAAVWGDAAPLGSRKSNHSTANRKSEWSSGVGPEAQAATARAGASLARQGYLSCVLVLLLARLSKPQVERVPGLLGGLLSGVSVRLASPLPAVRRQGMRVGRALSVVLEAPSPLFDDQGSLDLLPDELWPGALPPAPHPSASAAHPPSATAPQTMSASGTTRTPGAGLRRPGEASQGLGSATESDGVSEEGVVEVDSDDDSSLEEYDLHEDPEAEAWAKIDPKSMQLRAVCAALRKSDDVTGVLDTLKRVELLVRARPDELEACAHDLARALLHCRVPEWAQPDEGTRPEEVPSVLRGLALSALASVCPLPAGDVLLLEVFSPHLDTFQRLLIMQTLATAAQELSDPSRAPRLECPAGQAPRLVYAPLPATRQRTTSLPGTSAPALAGPATQAARVTHSGAGQQAGGQALAGRASDGGAAAGTLAAGKTRVWGHVALDKQRRGAVSTHRNTFADVALRWTHGLLREVDRVKHGVDLLGRDTLVLCSLLHTLGVFAECASASPAAQPVCVAVLELLAAPQVHGHAEAAVRRAVLLSAGQVLAALPAPGVAAAISGSQTSDTALVKRLQWLQTWLEAASQDDGDDRCRAMATACLQLHAALSGEAAFQALEMGHSAWPELGPAGTRAKGLGSLTGSVLEPVMGFQAAGSMVTGPMGLMRQGVVLLPHHAQVHL